MTLEYAILADAAKVRDNLLFLIGGGITDVQLSALPGSINASLAIMFVGSPSELGHSHRLEVRFIDQDGKPSPDLNSFDFQIPAATMAVGECRIGAVLDFQSIAITSPGTYVIDVLLDGRSYKQVPFNIHGPATAAA